MFNKRKSEDPKPAIDVDALMGRTEPAHPGLRKTVLRTHLTQLQGDSRWPAHLSRRRCPPNHPAAAPADERSGPCPRGRRAPHAGGRPRHQRARHGAGCRAPGGGRHRGSRMINGLVDLALEQPALGDGELDQPVDHGGFHGAFHHQALGILHRALHADAAPNQRACGARRPRGQGPARSSVSAAMERVRRAAAARKVSEPLGLLGAG